jgi:polysaccharide export outer membrane protein
MAKSILFTATLVCLALGLTACGTPIDGPPGEAVYRSAAIHVRDDKDQSLPYCLVSLTPSIGELLAKRQPRLAGQFSDRRGPNPLQIGIGDLIRVTLFESSAGGLFFPLEGGARTGNFLVIPDQNVDGKGDISIPYAGQIQARGRTPAQVQEAIVNALKNRAIEPQAVVTVVQQRDSLISVVGEVGSSVRFPASATGERVLDAIARAGGLRGPGQESWVLLERGGKIAVTPFSALIEEPANNIYVRAHDTLYVYREPQTYLAFGAVTRQGQIPFDAWHLSLAEAIAKAGGLLDDRAEPGWVFLFRAEHRDFAAQLDPKCVVRDGRYIPVIYEVNLRDPATYFLATALSMRNKDVVFVSNARTVEKTKLMTYIRTINSTIQEPLQTAVTAYTLKGLIQGTTSSTAVIVGGTTPTP